MPPPRPPGQGEVNCWQPPHWAKNVSSGVAPAAELPWDRNRARPPRAVAGPGYRVVKVKRSEEVRLQGEMQVAANGELETDDMYSAVISSFPEKLTSGNSFLLKLTRVKSFQ